MTATLSARHCWYVNRTHGPKTEDLPVPRSDRTEFFVLAAEVWGILEVDQLLLPHWSDVNVFGYKLLARPHGSVDHFGG